MKIRFGLSFVLAFWLTAPSWAHVAEINPFIPRVNGADAQPPVVVYTGPADLAVFAKATLINTSDNPIRFRVKWKLTDGVFEVSATWTPTLPPKGVDVREHAALANQVRGTWHGSCIAEWDMGVNNWEFLDGKAVVFEDQGAGGGGGGPAPIVD